MLKMKNQDGKVDEVGKGYFKKFSCVGKKGLPNG